MKYRSPYAGYDALVYTGSGLMGREIENIRSCDLVVFMGGRSGTLGEFAIAYDEGKVIGVLQGTGGISDRMEVIVGLVQKETGSQIVYSRDPRELLEMLIGIYEEKLLPYYKTVLANSDPDGRLES
jgi:predicted Rossmann-fold nucleotide-binding protein